MPNRKWLITIILVFPGVSFAQVSITEVLYDPVGANTGRQWIEVYNGGGSAIPLTAWKLSESGTNHKITSAQGGETIAAGAYGIISNNPDTFKIDYPQYAGPLFKSSFSLTLTGKTLTLKNASSSDIASIAYTSAMGAKGDGNSLNREPSASSLIPREPSPGAGMSSKTLQPAPKATKSSASTKSVSKTSLASGAPTKIIGLEEEQTESPAPVSQVAAVALTPPEEGSSSLLWWIAAGILGLAAAGTFIAAKIIGKKEWNIEEVSQ